MVCVVFVSILNCELEHPIYPGLGLDRLTDHHKSMFMYGCNMAERRTSCCVWDPPDTVIVRDGQPNTCFCYCVIELCLMYAFLCLRTAKEPCLSIYGRILLGHA